MIRMLKVVILLVITIYPITGTDSTKYVSYDGHQMWRMDMRYNPDIEKELRKNSSRIGFLRWHEGGLDVSVPPQDLASMAHYATANNVTYRVTHENLGETIAREGNYPVFRRFISLEKELKMTLESIESVLAKLANLDPTIFSYTAIGKSVNGRPIYMFKISNDSPGNVNVLVDAGQHPEEWSSILSLLYGLAHLAARWSDDDFPATMRNNNWHFIPVVNPDGFEYTYTKDRFWHKNRRPGEEEDDNVCTGVDLGRNFKYAWGTEGSTEPCDQAFIGDAPASESETEAIMTLLTNEWTPFFAYISMHTFGRKIIMPWLYSGKPTEAEERHRLVAGIIANKIKEQHGKEYPVGTVDEEIIARTSGTSTDWAFSADVIHSYLIRMGDDLFVANKSQVQEIMDETVTMLYALGEAI